MEWEYVCGKYRVREVRIVVSIPILTFPHGAVDLVNFRQHLRGILDERKIASNVKFGVCVGVYPIQ